MVISEQLITLEEFEQIQQQHPDKLLELVEGRVVEKLTSEQHGKIAAIIVSEIRIYLKNNPDIKGQYAVEASFRLSEDDYNERRPDVSFRLTDDDVSNATAIYQMPDFAVEVKSRSNTYIGLREKAAFYIANGTKLVWLVYPAKQLVEVYSANGDIEFFLSDETLTGGDILPNFKLKVSEIFE